MNLLLRMLWVLLTSRWRPRLQPLDDSVLCLRVWPGDLDLNLHMNNGRYLTLMDLGRLDLLLRTGMWRHVAQHRWTALVGGAVVRFRRSLQPFDRFELRSHLLGWDDKWFYIEQVFVRGDRIMAVGWVKGLLRGHEGNVPPADIVQLISPGLDSPPLPATVREWGRVDETLAATPAPPQPAG